LDILTRLGVDRTYDEGVNVAAIRTHIADLDRELGLVESSAAPD
jgi:hypothetical protein